MSMPFASVMIALMTLPTSVAMETSPAQPAASDNTGTLIATGFVTGAKQEGKVIATLWPSAEEFEGMKKGDTFDEFPLAVTTTRADGKYEIRASEAGIPAKYRSPDGRVRVHLYVSDGGPKMLLWSRDAHVQTAHGGEKSEGSHARIDFDLSTRTIRDAAREHMLDNDALPLPGNGGVTSRGADSAHMVRLEQQWRKHRGERLKPGTTIIQACPVLHNGSVHNRKAWAANTWGWGQASVDLDIKSQHEFIYGSAIDYGGSVEASGSSGKTITAGYRRKKNTNMQFRNLVRYDYISIAFDPYCATYRDMTVLGAINSVGTDHSEIGNHGFKNCTPVTKKDNPYKDEGRNAAFKVGVKVPFKGVDLGLSAESKWESKYSQNFNIARNSWICGNDDFWAESSQAGMHQRK